MSNLTTKFIFNRKNRLNKDGKAPVEMRIQTDGETRFLSTGIYLEPHQWTDLKGVHIQNLSKQEAADYAAVLSRMENEATNFYRNGLVNGVPLKALSIKERLKKKPDESGEFLAFCQTVFNASKKSLNYLKQHPILFDFLRAWEKENGTITFALMGYKFLSSFEAFLFSQKNRRYPTETLKQNYVSQLFRLLKVYTNEALKSDLLTKDPFIGFKITSEALDLDFLELEEVERMYQVEFQSNNSSLWREVRDGFCLSCWGGGWRFSDIFPGGDPNAGLRRKHIHFEKDGIRIKKIPKKTDKFKRSGNTPLWKVPFGKAVEIVQARVEGKRPDEFLFQPVSSKTASTHVKELLKAADIEKEITFHSARDTFINNMLLQGKRKEFVQAIVAHGSITTTERYERKLNERVDDLDR